VDVRALRDVDLEQAYFASGDVNLLLSDIDEQLRPSQVEDATSDRLAIQRSPREGIRSRELVADTKDDRASLSVLRSISTRRPGL
jgi:hypothetical protein